MTNISSDVRNYLKLELLLERSYVILRHLMHHMFVANVSKHVTVQGNAKRWIGSYININLFVKTNDYDLWIS